MGDEQPSALSLRKFGNSYPKYCSVGGHAGWRWQAGLLSVRQLHLPWRWPVLSIFSARHPQRVGDDPPRVQHDLSRPRHYVQIRFPEKRQSSLESPLLLRRLGFPRSKCQHPTPHPAFLPSRLPG